MNRTGRGAIPSTTLYGGFQALFEHSADAMILLQGNIVVDANSAALHLFHCSTKHELDGTQPARVWRLRMPARRERYEWQYKLPDGSGFWGEVQLTPVLLDHGQMAYATIRDITERKSAERNLMMAAQVFDNCRDAIVVLDRKYRVISVNQAFSDLMGYAAEDGGRPGCAEPALGRARRRLLRARCGTTWRATATGKAKSGAARRDGAEFPVLGGADRRSAAATPSWPTTWRSCPTSPTASGWRSTTRHLAEHDFLTDLPNRVLLLDRLQQALATARRQHTRVAVMFIDLDRFKAINDSFGHQAGDAVLKEIGGAPDALRARGRHRQPPGRRRVRGASWPTSAASTRPPTWPTA